MPETSFLAPPWGLPGSLDAQLQHLLSTQAWGEALALLRDHVPGGAEGSTADGAGAAAQVPPRLLALRALVRFQDAVELQEGERLAAAQEALALLDRAGEAGLPFAQLAPLREEAERVLAAETRAELAAEALGVEAARAAPREAVEDAALRREAAGPEGARHAARLFEVLAERDPAHAREHRAAAALARWRAGGELDRAAARPGLEAALALPWAEDARLAHGWRAAEAAAVALLEEALARADAARVRALWAAALSRGAALGRPFPATWEGQERLLSALLAAHEGARAAHVATRVEASREYLPRTLGAQVHAARTLARRQQGG